MARLSDRVVTGAPNGILSNDEPIQWYAADGITLIDGIKVDPAGAVYLAPAGGPTEVGGNLDVTGNIESSEKIRLGNNKLLQARNAADTQWRSVLKVDTNNDLVIGSSATPITLDVDTTVSGEVSTDGKFVSLGNVTALPAGSGWGVYGSQPTGGATIFGKGSGNDVQLLNGAGSIALSVPTGTTDVNVAGGFKVGNNKNISADNGSGGTRTIARVTTGGVIQLGGNGGIHIDVNGAASCTSSLTVAGNISGPNSILMSSSTAETIRVIRTGGNAASAELSTSAGYGSVVLTDASGTSQKIKAFGSEMRFDQGATTRMSINSSGGVNVVGALSKGSGSFRIDHPLKPETHQLVHSFTESPQADLLYSGTSDLVDGAAEINLDEFHGMTEGTFVALNRNIRVFTTNETDWEPIRGSVTGNILSISCRDASCSDKVSWMVIGERQDKHMMDTDWTDEQGRVIVEPLKPEPEPEAFVEAGAE